MANMGYDDTGRVHSPPAGGMSERVHSPWAGDFDYDTGPVSITYFYLFYFIRCDIRMIENSINYFFFF